MTSKKPDPKISEQRFVKVYELWQGYGWCGMAVLLGFVHMRPLNSRNTHPLTIVLL
jgi:hypothetical protein